MLHCTFRHTSFLLSYVYLQYIYNMLFECAEIVVFLLFCSKNESIKTVHNEVTRRDKLISATKLQKFDLAVPDC